MLRSWLHYKIAAAAGGLTGVVVLIVAVSAIVVTVLGDDSSAGVTGGQGVWCDPGGRLVGHGTSRDVPITPERFGNAVIIVRTGQGMRVPERGLVVAVTAATQESTLINLTGGDRDSVGLFQMRPSQGWGTPAQLHDPRYASRSFFTHLQQVTGWQGMDIGAAAQAVERSAFPDAYTQWVTIAGQIVGRAEHTRCQPGAARTGVGAAVVSAAQRWIGTPYAWAGGNENGPTHGQPPDSGVIGFDCSGLTLYAWWQATHSVHLPHQTQSQYALGQPVARTALQPGDLMFFSSTGAASGIHHVGIYVGGNQMIQAPQSGQNIDIVPDVWASAYFSGEYVGARRYG